MVSITTSETSTGALYSAYYCATRTSVVHVLCCRAWIARRDKLDQCLELQLFNRDCEQAETWMAAREASLEDSVDGSGDSVEALLKKHEDFDRAIASQEEKISAINVLANKACEHHAFHNPCTLTVSDICLKLG